MKRSLTTVAILVALALPGVKADILAPRAKGPVAKMRIIESQIAAGGAVLQIPADLVRVQTADIAPFPVPGGSAGWRDVLAGLLLTLGVVLGGKRFFNRSKIGHKILLPAILFLGAAAVLQIEAQSRNALGMAHASGDLEGEVVVQVRSDIKDVVLHLPPPRTPRRPLPVPPRQ